jgi:hypothetical protein
MKAFARSFLLWSIWCGSSQAFTTTSRSTCAARQVEKPTTSLHSSAKTDVIEDHPAVVGWPDKYVVEGGSPDTKEDSRIISDTFEVHPAKDAELKKLDVAHWPTWTTGDKPKWDVGNQVQDKEMPYGELSYMITGKLEIIPKATGIPVVVSPGDLVTFPKGFVASWKVLEELTWHYYLY